MRCLPGRCGGLAGCLQPSPLPLNEQQYPAPLSAPRPAARLPAVLSPPVVVAWPDGGRRSTYHDVKWNEAQGLLYAAGKDKCVDILTLG